jgi:hypothetical protein
MLDSNMRLLYAVAEASVSLEGIMSAINCTVEIVILIVYCVVI